MDVKSNNNITYTGLTKKLSKSRYSSEEIRSMVLKVNKSNGLVGHIPDQWVKQIPFEKRRDNITSFHKDMGVFVTKVLPRTKDSILSSLYLTHIMRRAKMIPKFSFMKIKFIDEGSFGEGYSLTNKKNWRFFLFEKV